MATLMPEKLAALVDDQPNEFRVSTSAYRSEAMFQQELDNIFYKTWIYLCHESEIAQPGDFKSTQIGTRPVIVSRGRDGQIHAVLNACTHRGATICREETGNTRAFVCPYHGWSFRPSGELIGIPDDGRYPQCFNKADKHLKAVPRIASYGGLVFGSFNPDVEPLETFLGGAKQHIDIWLKRTAGSRYRVTTSHKYGYDGNWKFQVENVCDGYHPGFVHRSAFNTVQKFAGRSRTARWARRCASRVIRAVIRRAMARLRPARRWSRAGSTPPLARRTTTSWSSFMVRTGQPRC